MPARIDPAVRRRHVVDAAFRLLVTEGPSGLSLRKVAAEAELNIGSVRHYFDSHEELLAAAAQEAGDRMGRRLAPYPPERLHGLAGEAAVDGLQALLDQVLPVDAERRGETIVVLELVMASRTRPVFAPMAAQMARDLHQVLREALAMVGVPDPDGAARQLAALVGGLSIDAVTPHGSLTVTELRSTLRAQLRGMLGGVGTGSRVS